MTNVFCHLNNRGYTSSSVILDMLLTYNGLSEDDLNQVIVELEGFGRGWVVATGWYGRRSSSNKCGDLLRENHLSISCQLLMWRVRISKLSIGCLSNDRESVTDGLPLLIITMIIMIWNSKYNFRYPFTLEIYLKNIYVTFYRKLITYSPHY